MSPIIITTVIAVTGIIVFVFLKLIIISGAKTKPVVKKSVSRPTQPVPDAKAETSEAADSQDSSEDDDGPDASINLTTTATFPTVDSIEEDARELIKSGIQCIPKLPGVTLEVLPILAKPGCGAKEIAQIIERDQPMAARLLRWVNSSFYGLENKVNSLHRAVALLGVNTIRSIVLEDSFSRGDEIKDIEGLKLETVWIHAAASSCASRHLANHSRAVEANVAATAGLLHDIGLLTMFITGKSKLEEIIKLAIDSDQPMIAHEFDILGANHQIYSELFMEAWSLPDEIKIAVGRHHNPLMEPFNPLVAVIWLANYIVSRTGFACPDFQIPVAEEDEINELMKKIGLRPPLDRYLTEALVRDLINSTHFFTRVKADIPRDKVLA